MSGRWPTSKSVREEVIDEVPDSELKRVMRDFEDAGAEDVRPELNRDGTWKVKALFRPE